MKQKVLLINTQGLGEQTLNNIAKLALRSQFNRVQHLAVQVKTDPNLLAQGRLESLSIDGVGLVMQSNLRMQEMRIHMGSIAVSPLKALMGNIQLTEPSQGKASFVLTETDLNRALNEQSLQKAINRLNLKLEERPVTVIPKSLNCRLSQGKIAIAAQLQEVATKEVRTIILSATPELRSGAGVLLETSQYKRGQDPSPQLTSLLLDKVAATLNLRNFEMPGLSLHIQQFQIEEGQLKVQAIAKMTHFPSSRS